MCIELNSTSFGLKCQDAHFYDKHGATVGVQNKYVNKYYVMHALKKSLQQKKSEKPVLLTKSGATGFQIQCHWNFQATLSKNIHHPKYYTNMKMSLNKIKQVQHTC